MSATQRHTATAAHGSQATYYDDSAPLYADPKIRLHYPPELYERVYAFAGPAVEAALDVACGTGQCAYQLAKRYKKVWAVDANEEQLKQCKPHPHITFEKGCAEKIALPSGSMDLVTVATALHWFDVPAFYKEARRLLKPSGALAAWCYWFPQIKHHEEANTILQKFREQVTGGPTTAVQRHAESRYKDLQPGPEEFGAVEWDSIPFVQESTVWHLVAFMRTGGMYTKMRRENPGKPDPLPGLQRDLMASLGTSDEYMPLELQCDIFMILAKDPKPL